MDRDDKEIETHEDQEIEVLTQDDDFIIEDFEDGSDDSWMDLD